MFSLSLSIVINIGVVALKFKCQVVDVFYICEVCDSGSLCDETLSLCFWGLSGISVSANVVQCMSLFTNQAENSANQHKRTNTQDNTSNCS